MINYVINLDSRTDKLDEFLENVKMSNQLSKEKFIRISAFDGKNYKDELIKYNLTNNIIYNYIKINKIKVNKGEFGCYMSHIITLYNILQNDDIKDDDFVGIYEDDFNLVKNFDKHYKKLKKINLNELGVEFLYIGGRFFPGFQCNNNSFEKTNHKNVFFRNHSTEIDNYDWDRTTHAYWVKKSICKKLISLLSSRFTNTLLQFTPIDKVLVTFYNEIKMFDYFPHLFYSELEYKSDIKRGSNNIDETLE